MSDEVRLNARGRAQVERLAGRRSEVPFAAIYSSPIERAKETAERDQHQGQPIAIVSHGDVIRALAGAWPRI